jgi:hypothetical protein
MAQVIMKPDCNEIVAKTAGVRGAVKHEAGKGAAIARGTLLAHRDQGHSQITVTRGELDYFVNLDDTRGDRAAAAIEFGRGGRAPSQGVRALSKAFGLTSGPRRRRNSGRAAGRN